MGTTIDEAARIADLGTSLRAQRRDNEAAALYREALALDPDQLHAWLGIAAMLHLQGDTAAAAARLAELVAEHPDSMALRANLGELRLELGQYAVALALFEGVLAQDPAHLGCRLGLARCLSRRPALALRLRSRQAVLDGLADQDIDPQLLAPAAMVMLRASPSMLADPVLPAVLSEVIVVDPVVEGHLRQARRGLCLSPPESPPAIARWLTDQCRLNEFAWPVSAQEHELLAMAPRWVRAMYVPEPPDPEPVAVDRAIGSLTAISEGTSTEVRAMYEANPYPRWSRVSRAVPLDLDRVLQMLTGGQWTAPTFLRKPRVLVVGCGTGSDLIAAALNWQPSAVTGIDLSRSSLAHARRMAAHLGIDVELYQADVTELGGWEREFDVIVCSGVLHHLRDPMSGWRDLTRLLRPGGVMLVGLYSRTARRGITSAQGEVARLGLSPTPAGIRAARDHISSLPHDHLARDAMSLLDFYYLSGCRDMLFHVQERPFSLPEISAALDLLGLRFLAFQHDPAVRRHCRSLFGSDTRLSSWESYERLYPRTFLGMYRFWCTKSGSVLGPCDRAVTEAEEQR